MVCPGSRQSRRITPFLSQKTVCITLPTEDCILNLLLDEEFTYHHPMDCCYYSGSQWWCHTSSLIMMQSRKLSTSALYCFSRSWQTCVQCSFCSVWASVGPIWHKLCDIPTFPPLFPKHWSRYWTPQTVPWSQSTNSRGWADQDALHFVVRLLYMAVWNVAFHCCRHCWDTPATISLCSINIQQASINVNRRNFFHMEGFNPIPLLHLRFHVRCYSVTLPLCCHLWHSNNMEQNTVGKVQPLLP